MNNQDKPSAKLDGFAPATGSGVSGSSHPASASASVASASAGGTSPAAHAAAAPSAKKPAASSVAAASTETKRAKKRAPKKTGGASAAGGASASTTTNGQNDNDTVEKELRPLSEIGSGFEPITLPQLQLRLKKLLDKLPKDKPEIPNNYDASAAADSQAAVYAPIKSFASTVQIAIEEYNLLLSLVSSATYRWGVDRSGASQQNLSVMSAELQTCQEVISNVVSARLSNVLCPAVDVLIGEVEIVRGEESDDNVGEADGKAAAPTPAKKRKLNEDRLSTTTSTKATNNERRINHYTRPLVDPSYVHLCHCILARNAPLILHSVATSIYTAQRVIGDYLNAMKKDTSHEASKGGYY